MSADTLPAWLELAEECRLETLHDTCLQQLAHCLATSGPYWPQQVGLNRCSACDQAWLAMLGWAWFMQV